MMKSKQLGFFHYGFQAMGSPCDIQLFARTSAEGKLIADLVIADVHRLEALYSRYRDDSFLSTINRVGAQGDAAEIESDSVAAQRECRESLGVNSGHLSVGELLHTGTAKRCSRNIPSKN